MTAPHMLRTALFQPVQCLAETPRCAGVGVFPPAAALPAPPVGVLLCPVGGVHTASCPQPVGTACHQLSRWDMAHNSRLRNKEVCLVRCRPCVEESCHNVVARCQGGSCACPVWPPVTASSYWPPSSPHSAAEPVVNSSTDEHGTMVHTSLQRALGEPWTWSTTVVKGTQDSVSSCS